MLLLTGWWAFAPVAAAGGAKPGGPPEGTHVSLSATVETSLPNDEVVVHFRVEATGKDVAALRARVNRASARVRERLAREKGVTLQTLGRRLEPVREYDSVRRRQVQVGWRLVQEGEATSRLLDAVPAWLDAIEKAGAHLSGLNYRVSGERRRRVMARLEVQAVRAFRERAAAMARALDAASYRIVRLSTGSAAPVPVFRKAAVMAMEAAAPPPALSPGQGRASVTVSGEIVVPARAFKAR